jgi:hypothetical protein
MQSGHVRVNGRWWILKVREWVVKDGVKRRVDTYKTLREIRHNEGGTVPNDVQALADLELAKVNLGQGQGQSADSIKSYLESYSFDDVGDVAVFDNNCRPIRLKTSSRVDVVFEPCTSGFI